MEKFYFVSFVIQKNASEDKTGNSTGEIFSDIIYIYSLKNIQDLRAVENRLLEQWSDDDGDVVTIINLKEL